MPSWGELTSLSLGDTALAHRVSKQTHTSLLLAIVSPRAQCLAYWRCLKNIASTNYTCIGSLVPLVHRDFSALAKETSPGNVSPSFGSGETLQVVTGDGRSEYPLSAAWLVSSGSLKRPLHFPKTPSQLSQHDLTGSR